MILRQGLNEKSVFPKVAIILIGGASRGSGGAGRRFARLFKYMQRKKRYNNVYLITTRTFFEFLKASGIDLLCRNVVFLSLYEPSFKPVRLLFSFPASISLYLLTLKHGFNVVHFVLPFAVFLPYLLFPCMRRPKISFSMTHYPGYLLAEKSAERIAYETYLKKADIVDALYESVLTKYYPHFGHKIRVSPCSFTDYNKYVGSNERNKLIVFSGRLRKDKNPIMLLKAARKVSDHLRTVGWQIGIFGEGPLKSQISRYIIQNGLSDIVKLQSVDDMAPIMNHSSIFCSLNTGENYPSQSLLEAMAAGNAIIATDVGETKKLVDGKNGMLVPSNTPDILAEAIIALSENDELRYRMGHVASKFVREQQSIDRFADYLVKFWE